VCVLYISTSGAAQTEGVAPTNDTCPNAIELVPPFVDFPDAQNATADLDVTCNMGTTETGYGVWYHYLPAADGSISITESSSHDVVIAIFEGSDCGSLSEVTCSDLGDNVTWSVTANTDYWILVGAWNPASAPAAPYDLSFTGPVPVELTSFSVR
jgi:hypothetical protein